MQSPWVFVFGISLLFAQAAPAQSVGFVGTVTVGATSYAPPPVTGAPYSGEEIGETVQAQADGTTISHPNASRKVWRDSMGRMRTESALAANGTGEASALIEISDPVAGYRFTLDTVNKVAHKAAVQPWLALRSNISARAPAAGMTVSLGAPASQQVSRESLGTQMIGGVPAEGSRITTVIPAGAQGNEEAMTIVSEVWFSQSLKITLLSKTDHPVTGRTIFQVANLRALEPDPALFQVPADFTIVEDPAK